MSQSRKSSSKRLSSNGPNLRRYRTRAAISEIDETLFGTGKLSAGKNLAKLDSRVKHYSGPATKAQDPEKILLVTKDLIRELKINKRDPSGQSLILRPANLDSIIGRSCVLTKEERDEELQTQQKAREKAKNAVEDRKMIMHQADLSRQKNQALSELDAEAKENAEYLLKKADTMRMEQEDEIKKLKQLILGAQCQAVWDTQIVEKKKILSELQEEERRLDAMMEADRQRALEIQEQIEELRKNQRIQGKMCNQKQIEQHQVERMLQEELKEQELQQMLESMKRLQMEEFQAMEKRKEEQKRLQLEIRRINEESMHAKEIKKEEERRADHNAMEYTRKKLAREAEYEAEQIQKKKEKEKEVAQLRVLQERARDYKAEQDALRARRNQEATEREWRRKEKEQAKKKSEENERLKAARLDQITHKEHLLSIEAGRKRAEFESLLRVQQELIAQEKEREQQHQQRVMRHAEEVKHQIRERNSQAITQKREMSLQKKKLDEEERFRRERLDKMKDKMLKELRAAGLPDKYCCSVERKSHNLPNLVQ